MAYDPTNPRRRPPTIPGSILAEQPLPHQRGFNPAFMPQRGSPMWNHFAGMALEDLSPFFQSMTGPTGVQGAGAIPAPPPPQMAAINITAPAAPAMPDAAVPPVPQALPQMPVMQKRGGTGLLDTIFGSGEIPLLTGLDKGQQSGARNRAGQDALLAASQALIGAGATPFGQGGAPSMAQAVMGGLQAGREAYRGALTEGRSNAAQERMDTILQQVGMDPARFDEAAPMLVAEALRGGDTRTAMALMQYMGTQERPQDKWMLGGGEDSGYFLYNQLRPDEIRPVNYGGQPGSAMPKRAADALMDLDQRYATRFGNTFNTIRQQTQNVREGLRLLESGQLDDAGAARMLTLYGFIRSIDPNSVVREGEVEIFNRATSWLSRLEQEVLRVGSAGVPASVREGFRAAVDALEAASGRREAELRGQFADNYGMLTGRDRDEMLRFIPSAFAAQTRQQQRQQPSGQRGSQFDDQFGTPR